MAGSNGQNLCKKVKAKEPDGWEQWPESMQKAKKLWNRMAGSNGQNRCKKLKS